MYPKFRKNTLQTHENMGSQTQSAIRKKMAAVHFTTMPYEPKTAYKAQRKPIYLIFIFVPVPRTLSSLGLKIL